MTNPPIPPADLQLLQGLLARLITVDGGTCEIQAGDAWRYRAALVGLVEATQSGGESDTPNPISRVEEIIKRDRFKHQMPAAQIARNVVQLCRSDAYIVLHKRSVAVAAWVNNALDDPKVCDAMKADITAWLEVLHP